MSWLFFEITSCSAFDHQLKCPVFTQKLDPNMQQGDQLEDDILQLRHTIMHLEHKIEKVEELSKRKLDIKEVELKIIEVVKAQSLNHEYLDRHMETERTEFLWKVPGISKLLTEWKRNGKGEVLSEVFITKESDVPMRARLKRCDEGYDDSDEWLSAEVGFVQEGNAFPVHLSIYSLWKAFHLIDQCQGNCEKRHIFKVSEPPFGEEYEQSSEEDVDGWDNFVKIALLENGAPYVVDDAILIRILIAPVSTLLNSFASNDGTLLWKIENYSKHKNNSKDETIPYLLSDYFYSCQMGYRMQIMFNFDFDRDIILMDVVFQKGEWDDCLPRKFPHKTTLMFLHQSVLSENNHLTMIKESDSTSVDYICRVSQSQIESPTYLKDDCLLLKVTVEPSVD